MTGDPEPHRFAAQLDIAGRACLVVGGGRVATRRARRLLDSGAVVTVIAPRVSAELRDSGVCVVARRYRRGDAAGFRLVVAATDSAVVNGLVQSDAEEAGIWCNRVDQPGGGDLAFPATARRGRLAVAVSTEGASPMLARWATRRIIHTLDPTVVSLVDLLAEGRSGSPTPEAEEVAGLVAEGRIDEALERVRGTE